jgi:hypothetical protein
MKKFLTCAVVWSCTWALALAQVTPPPVSPQSVPAPEDLPQGAIMPGFRAEGSGVALEYNPFEPIREVKTDENSELAKEIVKRLKGFVVQKVGAPLLVIDDKSYKVGDKVPLEAPAGKAGSDKDQPKAPNDKARAVAPAVTVTSTATIMSVTPTEAVFRIEDEAGFATEEFKIYYNFSQMADADGNPAYTLWDPVATGFFITDDGVVVAPLDVVRGSDVSVQTQAGPCRATVFESDEKKGVALLKVYTNAIPLHLAANDPDVADVVFGAGFWPDKPPRFCLKEGFVTETGPMMEIHPPFAGDLNGSAVLNKAGEAVGILVGSTEGLTHVARLSESDAIFRRVFKKDVVTPTAAPGATPKMTRAALEQAVVVILKKRQA